MQKFFLQSGALLGAISVALGAFGAHAFKTMLTASNRLETYDTAVKYQFYHAIALVLVGILMNTITSKSMTYAGYAFLFGVIIFSGSLYLICFTGITKFGATAPIGGLLMMAGWLLLFWAVKNSL
jgi:uncharacterized membrane protein YgdD (TMEM256/DUF423 family)